MTLNWFDTGVHLVYNGVQSCIQLLNGDCTMTTRAEYFAIDPAPVIHAVEGPAGAGKSTYMETDLSHLPTIPRPVHPRDRGPAYGAMSQSVSDFNALMYAACYQDDVAVDRFLISRWVYYWIEDPKNFTQNWYTIMDLSYRGLRQTAYSEAAARMGRAVRLYPTIELLILLPTLPQLLEQRALTGKTYPHDARVELDYYRIIADRMICEPLDRINVSVRFG